MEKDIKQLKLNVKGNFKNFIQRFLLKSKLQGMGLKVHNIKDLSSTHVELVVSGEKSKLWGAINLSKSQDIFIFLNEVIFEFADVAVSR